FRRVLFRSYDCGIAITAHPAAHRRAMTLRADYLVDGEEDRHPIDWNPEMSRRARATAVYATIRALGRSGIVEMVERNVDMALRYAEKLAPPRRGRDPQRGGAEPGPRPVPRPRWGRRRPHASGPAGGAGLGCGLSDRHDVGGR